ncbi:unnamed protein product [Cuscuta epithymum]|uniref:lipid IVA 3-deoxy-D-manno-octulosonic acid transferase n=2 Tax=Cuscuta epithymum TaxID=186058 RepID=A0AAV0E0L9_9ASTE|nr:unnamed protein product [Cuscuta epithymum]
MARERGEILYGIYRALMYGISPLLYLHLRWRKRRGLEHPTRWRERLGRPSLPRPPGPLVWFHAVSLGEGLAAISVIKCCIERRPDVTVLMTSTTTSAFGVIKNLLPSNVIYQFCPLDIPQVIDAFLCYWSPTAVVLMESEIWPNIVMCAAKHGMALALLNARMSRKSYQMWSLPVILPLTSLLLSKFSLIVPLSTTQGIYFQLLQASPFIIKFCGDLKYAVENFETVERHHSLLNDLKLQLAERKMWLASSIHKGEEEVMIEVHKELKQVYPDILTIIVPRHPQHGKEIYLGLQKEHLSVALRSRNDKIMPETNIYLVDTLGELRMFYTLTPIAVVGGSFIPGLTGHNISEAAAAGCATLTGPYIGHFLNMAKEMQQFNPLSVRQISEDGLVEALRELLDDETILEAHRVAAKQAYQALSHGIIENLWHVLAIHIF